jgi:DNA-binding SARP family transcriptional activator/tetratricopeptide (TPR) repeat protein
VVPLGIGVFGGVRVVVGGRVLPPGPAQQRAVLALLVLAEGRAAPRDRLIAALWPHGAPPSAWNIVQTHVKRLRAALEPDRAAHRPSTLIPAAGDGYALHAEAGQVDLWRFRALADQGAENQRQGDADAAFRLFGEALALWTGAPAADLPLLAEHPAVRALDGLRAATVAKYVDAAVALRRGAEVVELAEQDARARPLDECAQARLIRVYRDAGRRADAFGHFHRTRAQLAEQLGVDPGPDLAAAHRSLLETDDPLPVAQAPARRVPRSLPADAPDFVGRAEQIAALDAAGHAITVISGPAGAGKTALMLRWAHRVADRFPDGCLYVDLRGYGPQPPMEAAEALLRFLSALGIPRAEAPSDPDELAARYRTALAGRRMLILLDNARSPAQARPLLPGAEPCRTVLTSRSDLAGLIARDGARRVALDPLPGPEAVTLLHRLAGPRMHDEPAAALALAQACDRLPLALRIAAERVASRPAAALADLVAEFEDRRGRLDALSAGGDEATAVRAVFSWSYGALDESAARVFRLLGLHPGREFELCSVAALADLPVRPARLAADELARLHLIREAGSGRYTMHDLLRDYARERCEQQEPDTERRAAAVRLLDELAASAAAAMDLLYPYERNRRPSAADLPAARRGFETPGAAEVWLEAETETLLAAAHLAADLGLAAHVSLLSGTLHRRLHTAGRFDAMLDLHGLAARLLHELGETAAEGAALHDLGLAHHRLARYPEAEAHLRQALAIARKHGDRTGESGALHGLGMIRYRLGDLAEALAHFEEALAVTRALGDRVAEGALLGNIGLVHEWRGEAEAAIDHYRRALAIHRAAGFRVGEGDALNNLAIVHRQAGRTEAAIALLEQALEVYRAAGDRGGQGAALNNLGLAHVSTRRWERARAHLDEALAIHRAIGGPAAEAETVNILGLLDLTEGRPAAGARRFAAALALAEITADPGVQTNAHHGLAECRLALGDRAAALVHHERALDLARRTGSRQDEERALDGIARCRR